MPKKKNGQVVTLDGYSPPFISLGVQSIDGGFVMDGVEEPFLTLDDLPDKVIFNDVEYGFDALDNDDGTYTAHYCQ